MFIAAGAPLLLIPFIMKSMPESLPFLIAHHDDSHLRQVVSRLQPGLRMEAHEEFLVPAEDRAEGAPVGKLFHDGRGLSTVMFWIAFFMGLFMIYALSSWLTKLMAMSGYSLGSALTFFLVLQCGAMVGAISGGWLADKFHIKYVLIVMYVLGAVFLYMMTVKTSQEVLYVIVALVGATTTGTQILTYAYAGQFYPTAIRSTGIGFASGVGRAGAILAPILIGFLVSLNLPLSQNFLVIASAGLMGAIAVAFISHRVSASAHHIDATREDVLPASIARCCGCSGLTGGRAFCGDWRAPGPVPHGRTQRMSLQQAYRHKRIAAADAVRQVRNGDFIIVPTGVGEPPTLLDGAVGAAPRFSRREGRADSCDAQVRLHRPGHRGTRASCRLLLRRRHPRRRAGGLDRLHSQLLLRDPEPDRTRADSCRRRIHAWRRRWTPTAISPSAWAPTTPWPPIAQARAVVLEVNPNVPFAYGNCHVHISQVAALVESSEPVLEVGLPKIGPVQVAIGKYVADMIEDGSTLQIGYGGIPDAVVMQLTHKHDLGHPHRDDRRRHPDAGGERRRHEPAQELPAGKDGCDLRSRLQQALPLHGPQPGAGNSSGRLHQRSLRWPG